MPLQATDFEQRELTILLDGLVEFIGTMRDRELAQKLLSSIDAIEYYLKTCETVIDSSRSV